VIHSQTAINKDNLRKRYANEPQNYGKVDDHFGTTAPLPVSVMVVDLQTPRSPIFCCHKMDSSTVSIRELDYIKQIQSEVETIDTIDEIDVNPYVLTTYQVNDYVLRRYPPTKIGGGNPHKYGSWWSGPYQVSHVLQHRDKDITDKPRYNIRNLVTNKEYVVDVKHIRPFYYDPAYVTPLNIAVKDTDETVVEMIVNHDFSKPQDKKWLVRWLTDPPSKTSEQYENLKNVEAFQHYCATNRLDSPSRFLTCPGGQR
jgi:hypothetical protein